jgi:hypothetical protein
MNNFKRFYPHIFAVLGFVIVSLIYFYPVIQGKKIFQSDIVQYTAMAKEQNDFRAENNAEPYWTNSAFGGMPTYQLGANYPHNYIKKIDYTLRFLPRPADYLFLYFLGFYILLLTLKINPLKAFFGALAFGFSTYMIIIIGVGHNAKAHAIGYMPMVLAGVLLVYQKKYIIGGLLTLFALALEINANHFQMTYYLLILLLSATVYYIYQAVKSQEYKPLLYSFATFCVVGLLAIGANATVLLATSEYAKESTRGKNELTYNPDGSKNTQTNALTYDYITDYSYGILESFNLISPRIFGGSDREDVGTDSAIYEYAVSMEVPTDQAAEIAKDTRSYWGDQPGVSAPAYIGVVVFFLAMIALFYDNRKIKYVFVAGAIVSLLLSWGKNFPLLTNFFIDYVPLYNKFRAVSSIQVILEICMPVLAIMGLQTFFTLDEKQKWAGILKAGGVSLGILIVLFLFKGSFSFAGGNDNYLIDAYGPEFVDALKKDRKTMFDHDILRSALFVIAVFGVLWFFIKNKLSQKKAVIVVGLIMVLDLFLIAKNYLNESSFAKAIEVDVPFQATQVDKEILKDKTHYRVFEISGGVMSDPRASYFHKSIGGYSAVKPIRMQQLFDYHIVKNNMEILNMLHVKYFIQRNEKGEETPIQNTETNGNAWFVKQIKKVNTADGEMKALEKFDSKNTAILNVKEFPNSVAKNEYVVDSASIKLTSYKSNELQYSTVNKNDGVAVFSEMYYKNGWNVYIDGKLKEHFRVNYALRALKIPAGNHTVMFKFEPQVVKTGSTISLISFILALLLLIGGIYFELKQSKQKLKPDGL